MILIDSLSDKSRLINTDQPTINTVDYQPINQPTINTEKKTIWKRRYVLFCYFLYEYLYNNKKRTNRAASTTVCNVSRPGIGEHLQPDNWLHLHWALSTAMSICTCRITVVFEIARNQRKHVMNSRYLIVCSIQPFHVSTAFSVVGDSWESRSES